MANLGWFEKLYDNLETKVNELVESPDKVGAKAALSVLDHYKNDLKLTNEETLKNFLADLADNKEQEAIAKLAKETTKADLLIQGFLSDAALVIKEKKLEEEAIRKALQLAKDLTIAGAKHLLPLLLAL